MAGRLRALDARLTPGPISRLNSEIWRLLTLPDGHPDRMIAAQVVLYVGAALVVVLALLLRQAAIHAGFHRTGRNDCELACLHPCSFPCCPSHPTW